MSQSLEAARLVVWCIDLKFQRLLDSMMLSWYSFRHKNTRFDTKVPSSTQKIHGSTQNCPALHKMIYPACTYLSPLRSPPIYWNNFPIFFKHSIFKNPYTMSAWYERAHHNSSDNFSKCLPRCHQWRQSWYYVVSIRSALNKSKLTRQ